MIYKAELDKILQRLYSNKNRLADELATLPEGFLYQQVIDERRYYYERLPKSGNRKKVRRKGITKDRDRVMQLVRKEYINEALPAIEHDIALLEALIEDYCPTDENSIMSDFVASHPDLIDGLYYGYQSRDEWSRDYAPKSDFYNEDLRSTFAAETTMRSKGEIIIASRLSYYDIPFRYEAPIDHPDITFVPDFTIKRPSDDKIIYWEHMGMINDEQYMAHNKRKLEQYERYGIVPWDNLIVTYDTIDGGINMKVIDAMIQGWLL